MKPVEFSLQQMRDLLDTVEELGDLSTQDPARAAQLEDRLVMFQAIVGARVEIPRERPHRTDDFARLERSPGVASERRPTSRLGQR
ncbi:MAG TPA: hypothetical protein VFE65_07755 [Pseudonocardia sp.]|jgi:hypothetical protein|nr:hypothetical protein [Pseudonocardia sp.]